MYGLVRTVAPSVEPVTAQEALDHLRLDAVTEYNLIEALVTAAREHVEQVTARALITQTWQLTLDAFPTVIRPPRPRLQSASSLQYVDTNGTTQTLATSEYRVDTQQEPGRITEAFGQFWPSTRDVTGAVTLTYVAGYGDAPSDVPQPIKQAMLLLIGSWYEQRQSTADREQVEHPFAVNSLLWPYRDMSWM